MLLSGSRPIRLRVNELVQKPPSGVFATSPHNGLALAPFFSSFSSFVDQLIYELGGVRVVRRAAHRLLYLVVCSTLSSFTRRTGTNPNGPRLF